MSLVAVVVLFALLSIAAYLISGLFSSHTKGISRMGSRASGDQVLVSVTNDVMQSSFDNLVTYCSDKKAFDSDITGNCTSNGEFNSKIDNASVPQNITNVSLESLRNSNGELVSNGNICIELSRCRKRAGDRLVEVTMKAYWPDPSKAIKVSQRSLTFRKTRW